MTSLSPLPGVLRRRVLLVDDDAQLCKAVARQVQGLGYTADIAGDAAKAMLMASAYDYDVVITDLLMPRIDGMALVAILAQRSSVTSFILITGSLEIGARHSTAVDGRLTTVLMKPFAERELATALDHAFQVADKRRLLSIRPESAARVLLIEDSETDALLIQHALRILGGYHVTHAARLSDAVRLLHDGVYETVLTDLSLPDARGLGAVLRIRECAPEATLLVCSSVADEALALRVIELGAQDFLVKDALDPESLGRAIRFATVRRQSERRLMLLAHSDPLTGLWNRAAFAERLDQALAQARRHERRLAVMYIDLDGFKAINDAHGHDAGDALLKQVAGRITRCVREYDVVARLGGDEFAVMTTNLAPGGDGITAERIAQALAAPFETEVGELMVSASIGIACFPEDAEHAVLLVKLADEAMYCAKRAGKNRVWHVRVAEHGDERQA